MIAIAVDDEVLMLGALVADFVFYSLVFINYSCTV